MESGGDKEREWILKEETLDATFFFQRRSWKRFENSNFTYYKLRKKSTRNHLKMKKREARTFHLPPLDNKLTTFQLHSHQKFVLYRSRSYLESSLSRICIHQRGSSRCRFRNGVVDNAGAHAISNYWGPFNVRTSDTVTVYPSPTHVSTRILSCTHTQQNPFCRLCSWIGNPATFGASSIFSLSIPFFHEWRENRPPTWPSSCKVRFQISGKNRDASCTSGDKIGTMRHLKWRNFWRKIFWKTCVSSMDNHF